MVPATSIVDACKENPLMVWYLRLGHFGFRALQKLASVGKLGSLPTTAFDDFKLCVGCLAGNSLLNQLQYLNIQTTGACSFRCL